MNFAIRSDALRRGVFFEVSSGGLVEGKLRMVLLAEFLLVAGLEILAVGVLVRQVLAGVLDEKIGGRELCLGGFENLALFRDVGRGGFQQLIQ